MVKSGRLSINRAAKIYGIPYGSLGDKIRGRRPICATPRRLLPSADEERLATWVVEMCRRGFGQTREDIRQKALEIMRRKPGARETELKKPSRQWVIDFMKNHPQLTDRTPMALGKERAHVNSHGLSL
ncbi:tigger transposable element-derived protein 6-like protein [Elysia marginata]|uniref:Tigger transposable element-derived protein 6-like protein n=1 Tax=Elysia marginata TaxID=1093978 RepID=A0AAV4FI97_9GAST|nr:tigger transposable element-derived protein 6-like protein [Elysia marginata]